MTIDVYFPLIYFTADIYWNTLKTQLLIQCQIMPVIDNEMDKPDQLACIGYKNQNVMA